jgi:hypothetical protein
MFNLFKPKQLNTDEFVLHTMNYGNDIVALIATYKDEIFVRNSNYFFYIARNSLS